MSGEKYLIYSRNAQFYYPNHDYYVISVNCVEFCITKVLYAHYVDHVYFMLIVYIIIMFMCIMYKQQIRHIMMSLLQVIYIMCIRDYT